MNSSMPSHRDGQYRILLRELNERIIQVGNTDGPLAQRICGLVFLIGKLTRESGVDTGVRANKDHIADLIIDDLTGDNGSFGATSRSCSKSWPTMAF